MLVSLVIPAYNEEARLGSSLERVASYLASRPYKSETIVVDDGSKDHTAKIVAEYFLKFESQGLSLRLLKNPGNRGKGYSIRNGVLNASGDVVLFTDADLSAPITEIDRLIEPIVEDRFDLVFGSRGLETSVISTHQSIFRETAGRTFNLMMRILTGLNFKDTQCGFKAFNRKRCKSVFELQRINGFGFDVEVLYIAKKHKLRLLEMPVTWGHVEGSKVGIATGAKTFVDLATVRWHDICGRYSFRAIASKTAVVSTHQR
ncbi:MAG: glycosyltransferase family 2 protein [Blastocatellia bacterium]|nr:glycosyltransferase family 2 protein [Blastocatellia bacterium]